MTIDIRIDEDACVGCSLCAEVCPTKVLDFNESTMVPEIKKPAECFGCLSCSEICPATALRHGNARLAQSFYHDPAALRLAGLLGQEPRLFNAPTGDDAALKSAEADLGIRLLSVAAVLRQTLGQSLAAIGTQAGRSLAAQLPRYQPPASLDEALKLTQDTFAPAWDLQFERKDAVLTLKVKSCFIRELCQKDGAPTGGDLCVLFYGYLA